MAFKSIASDQIPAFAIVEARVKAMACPVICTSEIVSVARKVS
jgi:hypothetical protein